MKWLRVFFILFSLETLALLVLNLVTGSAPSEQVLFNLSLERLVLVIGLVLLLVFAFLVFRRSFTHKDSFDRLVYDAKIVFAAVFISFLATALVLHLLCLDSELLGKYAQVYQNFKPFLVWAFFVSLQSWLFSMTWFGHQFLGNPPDYNHKQFSDELLIVLGLFLLLVTAKLIFVLPSAYGPVIRGDELRYFEMAKYLYNGSFFIENIHHSPFLYPLMLTVSFAFNQNAYTVIKILNAIYSSGIIFPLFLIVRKYFPKKESLMITATVCVLPYHLLFPRVIMSENLYFPILLWVIFSILHLPQDKHLGWIWSFLTGISIGLLYMIRYITLALIPFLLLAWWVIYPNKKGSLFRPSRRKLLMTLMLCAGIVLGYSPWLFSGLAAGVSWKLLLGFGITANTTASQLTLNNLMIWVLFYLCYFILMASPVMTLFFTFPLTRFKEWHKESRDLYFLIAALLVGFLLASVRHSWRALYNGDLPSQIMGRYILYFTPLFIIAALLAMKEAKSYKRTSFVKHLLISIVFPLMLVAAAYYLLLGNLFHLHDGNLINILGSADAAYFQYLGYYFFILLLFIYGFTAYLTWGRNLKNLIVISLGAITLFYLVGTPAYYKELLSYQEFQYIGAKIVELHQKADNNIGSRVRITTPPDTLERERALLSNTIHFNNLDDFYVDSIENFNINRMPDKNSDLQDVFIGKVDQDKQSNFQTGVPLHFMENYYVILY